MASAARAAGLFSSKGADILKFEAKSIRALDGIEAADDGQITYI